MRLINGEIRLSATDLSNHLGCHHLTVLNVDDVLKRRKKPQFDNDSLKALQKRGLEHEAAYLESLKTAGLSVTELITEDKDTKTKVAETLEAMKSGVDIIFQATLTAPGWLGYADFLRKVDKPSDLGDYSYEVIDTKLAKETHGGAILQLCLYSEIIANIQGTEPEYMYITKPGSSSREGEGTEFVIDKYRIKDFAAYYRHVKGKLDEAVNVAKTEQGDHGTYPYRCAQCDICDWWGVCRDRRREDDHLSLVAGLSRMHMREFESREINTLETLAHTEMPLEPKPKQGSKETYVKVREQARVQLEGREKNEPVHELINVETYGPDGVGKDEPGTPKLGFERLPAPSVGDVYFDFEGARYVGDGGREYLFGYVTIDEDGTSEGKMTYHDIWGFTAEAEKAAFAKFMDAMMARWKRYPDFHIYHYAPYEPTAMKRLMGRHAIREDDVDNLLRAEKFVDLYAVVKQSIRASVERYSIKDLEPFYGFVRPVDLRNASKNLRDLEAALEMGEPESITTEMRETVRGYNEDDCVSTRHLHVWLEGLRSGEVARGTTIDRAEIKELDPEKKPDENLLKLREKLEGGVPADRADRSPEEHARWLLAQMLEFHRREEKSVWWEYFRLRDLEDEELLEEKDAIAGLQFVGRLRKEKKSFIDRYHFPPQEVGIKRKKKLHNHHDYIGTVFEIDTRAGVLDIKTTRKEDEPTPTSVFEHDNVPAGPLHRAVVALATWVAENGIDADGPYRAARNLLLGRKPNLPLFDGSLEGAGETTLDAAKRIIHQLDHDVLPIQGPPGCGKTYTGARMIRDLVRAGKKVGITAVSHKVIENFVEAVQDACDGDEIIPFVHRNKYPQDDPPAHVVECKKYEEVAALLNSGEYLAGAGTAWYWTDDALEDSVDVLFVDEAGQMSLTNVLALAQGAKSLVLLGDPQQLEQPLKGSHPEGSDVSALEYVLSGESTMPNDRGLFLGTTWRLPPAICEFTSELFYEGRLQSQESASNQELVGHDRYAGNGLWYEPVEHVGNQNQSIEEVDRVEEIVSSLLAGGIEFITSESETTQLTADQLLIVAPYNAQVDAIAERLPDIQVGTVDKFQGREAPVVIYSMTSSSPEDAPRGMEFLYSLKPLECGNVASARRMYTGSKSKTVRAGM